jgi:hypothetical protein
MSQLQFSKYVPSMCHAMWRLPSRDYLSVSEA